MKGTFKGSIPPDDPIFEMGLVVSGQSSKSLPNTTTAPTGERFGIVSFHEGELHSKPDSGATMSFGYFRTKTGLPPEVEKARDEAKKK